MTPQRTLIKHPRIHQVNVLGMLFVSLAAFLASALPAAPAEFDLSNARWKIQVGDNPAWSKNVVDDSDWRPIKVGASWEEQGMGDYDGYAWYRVRFDVPAQWQDDPELKQRGALLLDLGWVDDVDQTWFNGLEVGLTGRFPPNLELAYRERRQYVVPESLVRWGEGNVVAVRVYDGSGRGGMYSGACRLAIAGWNDLVTLDFDLGDGNGLYCGEDPVGMRLDLGNRSKQDLEGSIHWTLETDEREPVLQKRTQIDLAAGVKGSSMAAFPIETPGFYVVTARLQSAAFELDVSRSLIIGYEPEKVVSPLTKEDDFDAFWEQTSNELANVKPAFDLIRKADRDSDSHEVYEVKMRSLGGVRVGGWYEKPKRGGRHPAQLRVPGYGGSMWPSGTSDEMTVFSFNVRGHGNSQEDVKGEPGNFWIRGLDAPKGYYYQGAYADCVRAVDFLVSRPEVDATRIAVTGGSQGGGLSLATAALDSRIALCAPDIAFLCDWKRYFDITDWPEVNNWIAAKTARSWRKTLRTMSYFDVLNLVDRIECPVFFGLGLQDDVCPAATIFSVYNRVNAEKAYRVYPNTEHWVPGSHQQEKTQWIREKFGLRAVSDKSL